MFSVSLPMQRISANMEKEIANQQLFGRYTNPALDCRIANDQQRSQKSMRVKSSNDDSQKCGDLDTTLLLPNTQSLPLSLQQQSPTPTEQQSLLTISVDATNHQMMPIIDAVDINNRVVSLDVVRVDDSEKCRILVVDDSPLNRKMLSKLLKSKGYDVEEAADGQIAVDKIKQEADAGRSYDVILMDFVMPVMDGPTATRAIRAIGILIPIFGVTGRLGKSRHITPIQSTTISINRHWTNSAILF